MSRVAELGDKSINMPGNDDSKVGTGGEAVAGRVLLPDLSYKTSLYITLMRIHETTYLFAVFCTRV